jgi:hypothetical protein
MPMAAQLHRFAQLVFVGLRGHNKNRSPSVKGPHFGL